MEGKNQELRHALVKAMVEFRRVKPTIQMVCGLPAGEFFFLQRLHELANEGEVRVSSPVSYTHLDVYKRQVLIKKACGIESGSGVPNKTKVAKITREQVKKIAEQKMPDLNAANIETAMSMVAGTCRSMGVEVVD